MAGEMLKGKEISHRDFSARFKLIRHQRDYHFGEHDLMKDNTSKRRVIVKKHEYDDSQELKIIVTDYEKLCELHKNCCQLAGFIGFTLEENRGVHSINLIYDYHHSTLEEEMKSMSLHHEKFTEKEIEVFLNCMISALAHLEEHGFHHQSICGKYVLLENRKAIDLSYSLIFTPFLAGAVEEIRENGANVEDYNLAELQLEQLSKQKYESEDELPFSEKLRADKQSLGLMALRMATMGSHKDRLYTMDERYELVWDVDSLKSRMDFLMQSYSKSLFEKIEFLILDKAFYSFRDLPKFMNHQENGSPFSSASKLAHERNMSRSRKSHVASEKKPYGDLSFHESRLSRINSPSVLSSTPKPQPQSQDNSREKRYFNESPSLTKKLNRYQQILAEIQSIIFEQIGDSNEQRVCDDGSTYVGEMKGQRKEGVGICYFREGDVYGGEWVNDQMQGQGTYLFQNGDSFVGSVSRGLKEGNGKYLYANGNLYEGEWKNDKKEGYGVYHNVKGEKYEGQWKNGHKEGKGVYAWPNGDRFEGNFEKGIKSGRGIVTKSNGTKVIGNWRNDSIQGIANIKFHNSTEYTGEINEKYEPHGQGQQLSAEGVNYEGEFRNNQKSGKCKVTYANGDFYEGLMQSNKFEGTGRYFYSYLKCMYEGEWRDGLQYDAKGRMKFNNGSILECKWVEGKMEGHGQISYCNGDRYIGQINGLGCNGHGTYIQRNGKEIEGFFKNGVLLRQ